MALADSLQKVASKLMVKFGGDVTVRVITPGVYNPTTGTVSETITDLAIKGVLQDVTKRETNELVQAGDKRLIIAAADMNGTPPTTATRVIIEGRTLQVIQVKTIEQDNTPITYELILRD